MIDPKKKGRPDPVEKHIEENINNLPDATSRDTDSHEKVTQKNARVKAKKAIERVAKGVHRRKGSNDLDSRSGKHKYERPPNSAKNLGNKENTEKDNKQN